MFLSRRSAQAEYFDEPDRSVEEVAEGYRLLGRVNRLFQFARPFQESLPRLLGNDACRHLTMLDVGGGDGMLQRELSQWAEKRGWNWHITCTDSNPTALSLNNSPSKVVARAEALPFPDASFDVVIASQMTHHLESDDAVRKHFAEAWRVATRAVVIYDMHRNPFLYAILCIVLRAMNMPPHFRSDGLLSVRRGFRVAEWRRLAAESGLPHARVWLEHGARITLEAVKAPQ